MGYLRRKVGHIHEGKPCPRGHVKRYARNNQCVDCMKLRAAKARAQRTQEEREAEAAYQRQYRYGLKQDEHEALLEAQGGVCAICGSPEKLFVDHDHDTGEVRGLLCRTCNAGLGQFRDQPELLTRAATYLLERGE